MKSKKLCSIVVLGILASNGCNYGVQWTQDWYYGEDNNMSIGWTSGPIRDAKAI